MFLSSLRPALCLWLGCRFLFLPNVILVSSLKQLCWWNRPGHRTRPPVALKAPSTSPWTPGLRTELTKHPLRLSVNTACLFLSLFCLVGTDLALRKKGKGTLKTDIYETLLRRSPTHAKIWHSSYTKGLPLWSCSQLWGDTSSEGGRRRSSPG